MNKTALITGASHGIGYELAKIHAQNEDNLILVARSGNKLNEIKAELEDQNRVKVYTITKDLSLQGAARDIYDEVKNQGLEVDYLINNAGFGDFSLFGESDWSRQAQMINLNVLTLTYFTWLFLPDMIKRKSGKIMNLASTASFVPGPSMSVYFATKSFVLSFSEAVNEEVRKLGITVTALCPGPTHSGFQAAASLSERMNFEKAKFPSAKEVAIYGYNAMMKGKAVAIHGVKNRLMVNSVRLGPRSVVVKVSRRMQERKYK
jgi:uncharacterized protein